MHTAAEQRWHNWLLSATHPPSGSVLSRWQFRPAPGSDLFHAQCSIAARHRTDFQRVVQVRRKCCRTHVEQWARPHGRRSNCASYSPKRCDRQNTAPIVGNLHGNSGVT
jgi:hypothetical protein